MSQSSWFGTGALLLAIVGCSRHDLVGVDEGRRSAVVYSGDTSLAAFFVGTGLNPVYAGSTGEVLQRLGEPSLTGVQLGRGVSVLRFLWIRSFHPTIAIRLAHEPERCIGTTIVQNIPVFEFGPPDSTGLEVQTSVRAGTFLRRDSSDLPVTSCAALEAALVDAGIGTPTQIQNDGGVDGSEWVFELADSTGHRVMRFWSPKQGVLPKIWELGMTFAKLGNALPPKGQVY